MNNTIASLKGVSTQGLRVVTVGGFILASLGVCAAAEAQQTQKVEKKTEKQEVVKGELAPTTIIANRTETELSKVGSSVTVLDVQESKKKGIRFFSDALKFVPGVVSDTSSGQRGTTSSIFIRGNAPSDTGMMVDGIRMSGVTFHQGNFIGTANMLGMSKIEVLKGSQGVVYGANAMAGFVNVASQKGEGPMSADLLLEGGSFGTFNSMLGLQGQEGSFSYSLNLGYEQTDNDLPNNKFEAFSYALRLDYDVNDRFRVGFTLRGNDSTLDLPDFADPNYAAKMEANFDYSLMSFFAEYDVNDIWSSKLTLGYYDENYNTVPTGKSEPDYNTDSNKFSAYWDNTLTWNDQFTTVVGLAYEASEYDKRGDDLKKRDQFALYLNQVWNVTDDWTFTGGLRWEKYEDDIKDGFDGDVTTWRVVTAYTVPQTQSILRASLGTGFTLPSFNDLYYGPSWGYQGNPNLKPSESIGWDVGIEQPFADGQYKLGLTYFASRVTNLISWKGVTSPVNIPGATETSGMEMFAEANFLEDRLKTTLTYTWLDRQYLPEPLFLPKNVLSLGVDGQVTDQLNVGVTATYMDNRALYGDPLKSYALVNLYANYQLTENIRFNARVENLFDKDYFYGVAPAFGGGQTVRPGRGVGFFGGVTFSF